MSSALAETLRGSATKLSETAFRFAAGENRMGAREIVLHAQDLAAAQRERRRILSESTDETPLVLLRIEAVVAETFSQAHMKSAECCRAGTTEPPTIRYVGTPVGLAGLIADVAAADVADGVVIVSLPLSEPPIAILQQTIPWLQQRDLIGSISAMNDH